MQSIYRFRNAEVGLFIRAQKQGVGDLPLTSITLTSNFRSSKAIVDWHNYYFKNIFPSKSQIKTGAVHYTEAIASHHATHYPPVCYGFTETSGEAQAKKIITLVQEQLATHPTQTIAILVRARHHLVKIIPALKAAALPYQAIDIDPLIEKPIIIDSMALTAALLDPADRIAWLSVLRAPWCGLTLSDLLVIAGPKKETTILEQLQNSALLDQVSKEGQKRLQRVLPYLQLAIAERARKDYRAWIEQTWISVGGPASLKHITELEDIETYFELLSQLEMQKESFTINKIRERVKKCYAKPACVTTSNNPQATVQLMTIHSAKGLEFDTVILPHLEKRGAQDTYPLLLWMEQSLTDKNRALLLAPIHATGSQTESIYNYILSQEKIKLTHELDRLFYVAATRAKNHLYLLFHMKKNSQEEYVAPSGSFLKKIWPYIQEKIVLVEEERNDHTVIVSKTMKTMRLHEAWQSPLPLSSPLPVYHRGQEGFKFSNNNRQLLGTLIHRLFQQFAEYGITTWQNKTKAEKKQCLEKHLCQAGVAIEDLPSTSKAAYEMLQQVLEDQTAHWIFHPHQESQTEYAISAVIEGEIKHLIIDRTFVEKDIRWIIDYKTTLLTEDPKKLTQYTDQLLQYKKAMQLLDSRPIRLGLYFPAVPKFEEISD